MIHEKSLEAQLLKRFNITLEEYKDVISRFINEEGKLRNEPKKQKKKVALYCYLASLFQENISYNESDVNGVIGRVVSDFSTYRRALVDYALLKRELDGSAYYKNTNQ